MHVEKCSKWTRCSKIVVKLNVLVIYMYLIKYVFYISIENVHQIASSIIKTSKVSYAYVSNYEEHEPDGYVPDADNDDYS